ncbi:MAG: nucleotidyl transferase AbiEii/AbiGii toxin family protein [Candidatus Moraniibacteriota bacterium]|nr:MAG: nucleotidyl transferase AbiEii/AbiGii toxin family protein [Candidatus Moranbacteria bacterium]
MILPHPEDAIHKAWLYRLLSALVDDMMLASVLRFKGGTCAAMLGYLDRFSVDLDFDLVVATAEALPSIREKMEAVFTGLGLEIKDASKNTAQYFLRYPVVGNKRNSLKVDVTFPPVSANKYQTVRLPEIDRLVACQSVETMFANKLVALIDRYEKNESLAGRDVYDIHHFFLRGFRYTDEVIRERRGTDLETFFRQLFNFVEKHVTEKVLTEDLNSLLPYAEFSKLRKVLKQETLMFLHDERTRVCGKK